MSVCLFVCQQVACDVVTVYSRSESPCHVSLSQSNRYRSFARRSISHNSPVSFSISLSVSVGACTMNNTRPRALTSAVRSSALSTSSLSLHFIPSNLSRARTAYPNDVATSFILRDRTERGLSPPIPRTVARFLSIASAHIKHRTNPRTRRRMMLGEQKVATEKVRAKCGGTRWRRPRKWDRKEDDAPTTDLGSSNEANALC